MIYIFYSCFNNYDLLIGENLNFLKRHSKKIILVDDHSTIEEQTKGKSIAKKLGLRFEINPGKGLQAGVDFIVKNICNKDDWILTIQQDVHFKCDNAVDEIEDIAEETIEDGHDSRLLQIYVSLHPRWIDSLKKEIRQLIKVDKVKIHKRNGRVPL